MAFLPPDKKQISVTAPKDHIPALKALDPKGRPAAAAGEILNTVVKEGIYATPEKQVEAEKMFQAYMDLLDTSKSNTQEALACSKELLDLLAWHKRNASELYAMIFWLTKYLTGEEPVDNLDQSSLKQARAMALANFHLFSK